ncbi:uncharacterized protein BJX67DRAFT_60395 [Aspergillus lucknowensis]|uniref:Uncharacterized protein n=1 Tax=Aspergillus lucknowensis TaxID=176173 RepID=A0ABR4LXJ9_9EURO
MRPDRENQVGIPGGDSRSTLASETEFSGNKARKRKELKGTAEGDWAESLKPRNSKAHDKEKEKSALLRTFSNGQKEEKGGEPQPQAPRSGDAPVPPVARAAFGERDSFHMNLGLVWARRNWPCKRHARGLVQIRTQLEPCDGLREKLLSFV